MQKIGGDKVYIKLGKEKHPQTLQLGRATREQTSRQHFKVANNNTPPPMVSQQRENKNQKTAPVSKDLALLTQS